MGLLDGKVAVVTGAGRGIGREEALVLAGEGARVVVNDVGAGLHGEGGADVHPAEEVVELIKKNGGEAAVNGDDISTWAGGKAVVDQAIDTFGSLDILVNNAGILRDKMIVQHGRVGLGRRDPGPPQGTLRRHPPRRRSTGATAPRPVRTSPAASSTRRRRPASSATPARPTTRPPRRASPRSRGSRRASSAATASRRTPSRRAPAPA